jgi:hypothetical protein
MINKIVKITKLYKNGNSVFIKMRIKVNKNNKNNNYIYNNSLLNK